MGLCEKVRQLFMTVVLVLAVAAQAEAQEVSKEAGREMIGVVESPANQRLMCEALVESAMGDLETPGSGRNVAFVNIADAPRPIIVQVESSLDTQGDQWASVTAMCPEGMIATGCSAQWWSWDSGASQFMLFKGTRIMVDRCEASAIGPPDDCGLTDCQERGWYLRATVACMAFGTTTFFEQFRAANPGLAVRMLSPQGL